MDERNDSHTPDDEVRQLRRLLKPMLKAADKHYLCPRAAGVLLDGLVACCARGDENRRACIAQLSKSRGRPALRKILERRFLLQPLIYFSIVTTRLGLLDVSRVLGDPPDDLWVTRLVGPLGEQRVRQLWIYSHLHHLKLAEHAESYCIFLARMSPGWREKRHVKEVVERLERRVETGHATAKEKNTHKLLNTPLEIGKTHWSGKVGRPLTSLRDTYLLERHAELKGGDYLQQLSTEVTLLFGKSGTKKESLRRQIKRYREKSPIWVEVPRSFTASPLGKSLVGVIPPPFSEVPWVRDRLVKDSTNDGDEAG